MPRHPGYSPPIAGMPATVYSSLAHRLSQIQGETYPLHVGDTWMEPAEGCRMEDLRTAENPGMHRYAPVQGLPRLLSVIAERVTARTGHPTRPAEVLVTAGGTGGLGAVVGGIVAPGDEVLILAPHWPLIAGIVTSFHGRPVPVSILGVADAQALIDRARAALTPRTVALYVNTPNNPTGRVLSRPWMEALAAFARANDLWLISDEVYEDYVYAPAPGQAAPEHVYARPLAPERTFSAYSYSKAWGMAGNRAGYIVGPEEGIAQLRKVSTHTFYSTPTAAQIAALRAYEGGRGDAWAQAACAQYADTSRRCAEILGVPAPEGSTFLFLDVADALDARGLEGLLSDGVDRGLLVAPGPSFGPFPTHIRLCFTCVPPDVAVRGVTVLAALLDERRR